MLEAEYPEVKVIALDENKGFWAAVNVGICESKGELVDCSIMMSRPIPAGSKRSSVLPKSTRGRVFCLQDVTVFAKRRPGWGGRCVVTVRGRTLFESIGLFDEDFVAFQEDIDLSLRAQWAGCRCLYVPRARIYHVGGGTAAPDSPLAVRLAAQNQWNLAAKNVPRLLLLGWLTLMLVAECYRMGRARVRRRGVAYWRGLGSAVRLLPSMLGKRRQVLAVGCISTKEFSARIRQPERRALPSLIRSNAHPIGVTRLLQ